MRGCSSPEVGKRRKAVRVLGAACVSVKPVHPVVSDPRQLQDLHSNPVNRPSNFELMLEPCAEIECSDFIVLQRTVMSSPVHDNLGSEGTERKLSRDLLTFSSVSRPCVWKRHANVKHSNDSSKSIAYTLTLYREAPPPHWTPTFFAAQTTLQCTGCNANHELNTQELINLHWN